VKWASGAMQLFSKYLRSESGSYSVIGAIAFSFLITLSGGILDISRLHQDRERAQAVADATVLSVASEAKRLGNFDDGKAVGALVAEINGSSDFTNNGYQVSSEVVQAANGQFQIRSTISGTTKHSFLGLIGRQETSWNVDSSTVVSRTEAEVILVLDVSLSMVNNQIFEPMKEAAIEFVEALDPYSSDGSYLSVSIIPFAETVNLGPGADVWLHPFDGLDFSSEFVGCFRIGDNRRYDNLQAYPTGRENRRIGPRGNRSRRKVDKCPPDVSAALLNSTNERDLIEHIDGMDIGFGTGSNTGLVWAERFFDEDWRQAASFSSEPFADLTPSTRKFVLFLTDGRIFWTDEDQNGVRNIQNANNVPVNHQNKSQEQVFVESCESLTSDPTIEVYSIGYSVDGVIDNQLATVLRNCVSENGDYFETGRDDVDDIFASIENRISDVYLTR